MTVRRPPPLEVEAKLLARDEQSLRAIARLRQIDRFRLRPRDLARLHSVYLDTEDFALARRRIALRLRRHARRWELTAKWGGRVIGTVHERTELTVPLTTRPRFPFRPQPGIHPELDALVGERTLRPILITDIRRRRIDVLPLPSRSTRRPLAELALDHVRLRASQTARAVDTYCEIEIERLAGTRRDVARLADVLRERFALTPSEQSKFSRGLSLLYGGAQPPATLTGPLR